MTSTEIKSNARESLKGKWGKAALLTLVFGIIDYLITLVLNFIPFIGSLISFVISLPLSFGFIASLMKLKRGEEVGYVDFFTLGFQSFGKVWAVFGNTLIKMIVPIILVVVAIIVLTIGMGGALGSAILDGSYTTSSMSSVSAGFSGLAIIGFILYFVAIIYACIKYLLYSLSNFILFDNPDMSGKDIVNESEKLMKGNRWSYVWLNITFIGWSILATFTLGIGFFWLAPYMMISSVCFYEKLAGKSSNDVAPVATENPVQTEE